MQDLQQIRLSVSNIKYGGRGGGVWGWGGGTKTLERELSISLTSLSLSLYTFWLYILQLVQFGLHIRNDSIGDLTILINGT